MIVVVAGAVAGMIWMVVGGLIMVGKKLPSLFLPIRLDW